MELHVYSTSERAQRGDPVRLKDAFSALKDNAAHSQHTTVISAFYGADFIKQFFLTHMPNKHTRSITLIFAASSSENIQGQIAELKTVRSTLMQAKYAKKRVDIRLATLVTFLHTKLFVFKAKSGHKRYMLGSANFSSAAFSRNDELLVLHKSTHAGLDAYIDHVLSCSQSIDDINVGLTVPIHDWRTFFREGFLYFKPARQVPYTVNCFVGDDFSEVEKRLEKATKGTSLIFHDAAGIGSLNLAKLMKDNPVAIVGKVPKRVRIAAFSVETAFGYWVPNAYRTKVDERIEGASSQRRKQLKAQGDRLGAYSNQAIQNQIDLYLDDIDKKLGTMPLSKLQRDNIEDHIQTKLKRLIQSLTEDVSLDRLSRPFMGAPVPEFWEDEHSGDEFFETFAQYVAYVLSGQKRFSIISHIKARFSLKPDDDPETIRTKMEAFFTSGKEWRLNDWPLANDAVEDEDFTV
jgi:hypothetical protein